MPVPDSTVGTQDRPHVNAIYAGIEISAGTPDICGPLFSALQDARRVSTLVAAARKSALVDPRRVSDLECD